VVYVSGACKHSRNLLDLMERTGFADSFSFVNVDTLRKLPRFVDRVPLLYDGSSIVTDEDLFDMFNFSSPAAARDGPTNTAPGMGGRAGGIVGGKVEAAESLCGNAFETTFDDVSGVGQRAGMRNSCWRLDEAHDRIETPECQPMPSRDKDQS
jgi:hypothetical protein